MADPLVIVTAVGAGIAIVQPWAIALWKRYIRKGTVTPYVTGFLEIGFSEFGPTLAIDGTLRAHHKDVFIKSIQVVVTKHKDNSQHTFDWLVFRPYRTSIGSQSESAFLEAASGFMVSPDSPKRVCIVFSDPTTREEIQKHCATAINKYWELRRSEQFAPLDHKYVLTEEDVYPLVRALGDRPRLVRLR
jgi:hypothetical protein